MVVLYLDNKLKYRAELNQKFFDLKMPAINNVKLIPMYYSNKNYFHDLYSNIIFSDSNGDGILHPKGIIYENDNIILPYWFNNIRVLDYKTPCWGTNSHCETNSEYTSSEYTNTTHNTHNTHNTHRTQNTMC